MKLYFGNMVTTVTTIMIIALVGFIGYSVWNRNTISYWGCRNLFLLMYGLVICCFAAARDGLKAKDSDRIRQRKEELEQELVEAEKGMKYYAV